MKEKELFNLFKNQLNFQEIDKKRFEESEDILSYLVDVGILKSYSQGKKMCKLNSISINGKKVSLNSVGCENYKPLGNCLLVIKTSKKDFYSIFLK